MTAQQDEKESSSALQLEFGCSPSMSRNKCIIFVSYICIHIEPTNLPDKTYKLVSEAEAGSGEAQVNFADVVENPNPTPEASN